jgi:hypothetical protein
MQSKETKVDPLRELAEMTASEFAAPSETWHHDANRIYKVLVRVQRETAERCCEVINVGWIVDAPYLCDAIRREFLEGE